MSDNPSQEPAEADTSNTVTNISGGVNLNTQRDMNIGSSEQDADKEVKHTNVPHRRSEAIGSGAGGCYDP